MSKLTILGFVWRKDIQEQLQSNYTDQWEMSFEKLKAYWQQHGTCQVSLKTDAVLQRWRCWRRQLFYQGKLSADRVDRLNEIPFLWSVQKGYWMKMYVTLIDFCRQYGHSRVPFQWAPNPRQPASVYSVRTNKPALSPQKVELLNEIDSVGP